MIELISQRDVDKAVNILSLYLRLKNLYSIEELILKYEEEKLKLLRDIEDFKSTIEDINKYNFYFDFNSNSTIKSRKDDVALKEHIISILLTFERTRYFLKYYTII